MEKIFKAMRLDTGEWFEFELKDLLGSHNECLSFIMDKNTICQYTGIDDSEGNRIFEGDDLELWIGHESYSGIVNFQQDIDYPAFDIDSDYADINNIECNKLNYFCCEAGAYMKITSHNIHDKD